MEITEVRIKLMEATEDRLRGFCSITFDNCFVVRDLKIIQGNTGPFVAMPSRKLTANCNKCRTKNHLRANFCNQCGERIKHVTLAYDASGRAKLYADIAHPVNARCREMIQSRIIEELNKEIELASLPGYRSRYDDDYDDDYDVNEFTDEAKQRHPKVEPVAETGDPGPHSDESSQRTDGRTDERIDEAVSGPPAPHDPPPETSSPADTDSKDEFGKGIF